MGTHLAVTGWPAVAVALLTQLADVWFLATLAVGLYWLDRRAPLVGDGLARERTVLVLALLLAAVATVELLKPLFAVPRPPGHATPPPAPVPDALSALYAWLSTADGYGFPSGHAVAAAAVWPALARAVRLDGRTRRFVLAWGVVAVVAATRVLLGVHAPVDVVAGVLVGAALFWVTGRAGRATPVFLLAAVVAAGAVGVAGPTAETVATLGLPLGAVAVWWGFRGHLAGSPSATGAALTSVLGALVLVPLGLVATLGAPGTLLAGLAGVLAGATVVGVPAIGEWVAAALR